MSGDELEKAALISTHNNNDRCFVGVIDEPWAQAAKRAVLKREGLNISDMFQLSSAAAWSLINMINAEAVNYRP